MNHGRLGNSLFIFASLILPELAHSAGEIKIDYAKDIQPLFAEHCYACHGPDSKTRKAGLRYDQREIAIGELESGKHAIVPGNSAASEMVMRLFSDDPDVMMPPPDFRKQLSLGAKRRIKKWIDTGAQYSRHWAFEPVTKPEPPEVMDPSWPRNEIDHFILARLEREGMQPSREADPATLARRLSLDFRGLPPSIEEIRTLAGDNSESAFDRAIDKMLAASHYGERMAQAWLDLARYGDTNGYHADSDRSMWLYRDYVIDAFNANKPYDRFIIENMAGDLLPDANVKTRIASGFNRCVTFNEEGGADPDEFYVTYAIDRANTTGQVFLGLTVGCAQCHDHKYDPISQKEYYQFYAFFNSLDGEIGAGGAPGYHGKPLPPLLKVKPSGQEAKLAMLNRQIIAKEGELKSTKQKPDFADPDGPLRDAAYDWANSLVIPSETVSSLEVKSGLQLHLDAQTLEESDGEKVLKQWGDSSGNGLKAISTGAPKLIPDAINGRAAVRLDGKNDFLRTESGGGYLGADFTMVVVLQFHNMSGNQMALMWGGESQGKRRSLWKTPENKLSFNGHGADVHGNAKFKINEPAIAIVTQQGSENLTKFNLNGNAGGEGKVRLSAYSEKAITIGANNGNGEKTAADFAEVLVYDRALNSVEQAAVGRYLGSKYGINTAFQPAPNDILAIVAKARDQRSPEERQQLFDYFIQHIHPESRDQLGNLEREIGALKMLRNQLENESHTTMVMVEMQKRKPAYVLMRGDFQQPGEQVQPDVPAIFPQFPEEQPRNRLGLAHWLTDPSHPLVARVTVNRLWKQLFGTGLVKTLGDFGTQGERPSHPELLDWLAADFVEHGWDVKRLQKLIVQSSTYRQSPSGERPYGSRDPDNRWLSRAPRFRLSAEEIRDTSLAISGLLNREIGGPSVNPYQPSGYLNSIGKPWEESSGDALYRRGLYTFWRRTMLYPAFMIFDAPSREFCTVDRPRTNTPLQALVTLNDPAFVEAARKFGERILQEGGERDAKRLVFAFVAATSRHPSAQELALLNDTLVEQRSEFEKNPGAAKQLLSNGKAPVAGSHDPVELAAWTAVGNILLNLDETITRE
ncbi:MAG: DUF1553 domain-containing protein [Verrucomicrobia bacterium]|nr:DUF1553 domain-containing protein [Verrucomicrobiota bacterium]